MYTSIFFIFRDIDASDSITGKIRYRWAFKYGAYSCVINRTKPLTVNIIFETTPGDIKNLEIISQNQ